MKVKRGPKPTLNEEELIEWMDSHAGASRAPTMKDIKDHAKQMVKVLTFAAMSRVSYKFGKKWWALFRNGHKTFVGRKPQLIKSQRAPAKLAEQGLVIFFQHLTQTCSQLRKF